MPNRILWQGTDPRGISVSLSESAWQHIAERHKEITNIGMEHIFSAVENPVEIRLHSTNPSSEQYVGHLLTKGFHAPATIVVATTVSTEPKHIKSAWITNLPVKGLLVWSKDSEP
jgi:hypothetical protein